MADEIPLESILPAEAIAKIRKIVAEVLSQPPQREGILEGNVYRPFFTATAQSFVAITPQLIDPVASKKLWESPLSLQIIQIIVAVLLLFYQEYREDLRDAGTEKFMQVIVKQVEEFVQAYQEQSTATPKPTPDAMGD